MQFDDYPKIPRLHREIIVTEKIDGTNASILITPSVGDLPDESGIRTVQNGVHYDIYVGSRTRWITPDKDNHGFARWCYDHIEELLGLGVGHHFGEWWGKGIQRGYGLDEKRFSLFNTTRWAEWKPDCCHVVPEIVRGTRINDLVDFSLEFLRSNGSVAAPGYSKPEGVVAFHTHGNFMVKATLEKDDVPKNVQAYSAAQELERIEKSGGV